MLQSYPYIQLGFVPTPIEAWNNLGTLLGISLRAKRDDLNGLGGGGNKIRKLEFLLADAQKQKADYLITAGAVQSNHVRQTMAAAVKHGMKCRALLRGIEPRVRRGNLLLDELLGGETEFYEQDDFNDAVYSLMDERKRQLVRQGYRPYIIPIGGSSPLGSLGYVSCAKEIRDQLDATGTSYPDYIVVAMGSGGTFAGLVAGCSQYLPKTKVIGIVITTATFASKENALALTQATAKLAGIETDFSITDLELNYDYIGPDYSIPSEAGNAAIKQVASLQAVFLDPTYTGKVFAGLVGCIGSTIAKGSNVLFIHTGGSPALFT